METGPWLRCCASQPGPAVPGWGPWERRDLSLLSLEAQAQTARWRDAAYGPSLHYRWAPAAPRSGRRPGVRGSLFEEERLWDTPQEVGPSHTLSSPRPWSSHVLENHPTHGKQPYILLASCKVWLKTYLRTKGPYVLGDWVTERPSPTLCPLRLRDMEPTASGSPAPGESRQGAQH